MFHFLRLCSSTEEEKLPRTGNVKYVNTERTCQIWFKCIHTITVEDDAEVPCDELVKDSRLAS